MPTALTHEYRVRKNFGKIHKIIDIPNLIQMQKESYELFLQRDVPSEARSERGLQEVFKSVFPIEDFSGTASLEFVQYSFGEVKYEVEECLARGMTYEAPVKIVVRLVVYDVDKEAGTRSIRDIKEQEIYFGTLPLMTDNGTFIINGTERVIVSQLHRSPGIFFDHDRGKTHSSGKILYSARIIPLRGSWLDLEFDPKDILYIRIDRRRKFPVTVLLKALGYATEELLNYFYPSEKIFLKSEAQSEKELNPDILMGSRAPEDILHPQTGEVLIKKNRKLGKQALRRLQEVGINRLPMKSTELIGQVLAQDVIDYGTGEIVAECNDSIDADMLKEFVERGVGEIELLHLEGQDVSPSFRNTLLMDKVNTQEDALIEIYRRLRPSNPPTLEVATEFFNNLFFNPDHYDLSEVGRLKLNLQLGLEVPLDYRTLRKDDILMAVRQLIRLKDSQGPVDDIDNLGNRRVRAVGELLENQYRIGLVRMERAIKERMTLQEVEALMPHDLINAKPVSAVVKEFFGTSQLSQFMDQTNPLSEITHKRRLSALGPGGLTRERAGFEVRDVHPTHYGRICPIETPEGPNIGLIVSLSTYARVNPYGFIETPYRKVDGSSARKDVSYLTAMDEKEYPIAQANAPLDEKGRFLLDLVSARVAGEPVMVPPNEIRYMDVSPNQLVSVSASLIPFLEHDDANRALMGSNMQRQAVPLIQTRAPLVGTGIERIVAKDSGVAIVARRTGVVEYVDATRIVIRAIEDNGEMGSGVDIYKLIKFQRSNQNTCINQKPLVQHGDLVTKGQIIADGPSTDHGELALGRNVMVAFMSWGGYNFEDSILVSERIGKEDVFTSIHIEEFEVVARDTKLGKEDITRDIPNVGEEALKNLDESGIIRVGAYIKPNDILVGKVTPKGESQLTPEEKLLRAIFGEKASDVKDTSLRVPPGVEGIIIDAKVFSRKGVEKDERTKTIEDQEISRLMKDQRDELEIIFKSTVKRLAKLLENQVSDSAIKDGKKVYIKKGEVFTEEILLNLPSGHWDQLTVAKDPTVSMEIENILANYREQVQLVKSLFEEKIGKLKRGDELPPGVIKMVKVYVAVKRKLQVGDKMAGRHGNKGVVSRILPAEDMPYFPDGTPVDIVLNPLGVPSRMNVGQVLETHIGWAAKGIGMQLAQMLEECRERETMNEKLQRIYNKLEFGTYFKDASERELRGLIPDFKEGIHVASPVFDGAEEAEIRAFLSEAGVSETGQSVLYDGRTGMPFDQPVTVGVMYMLKLHHLVDDKIHARSIGPYSLVTQQPLGGKAQFGGQRLGEMEVWTMEAYGAAYALQEFLTVKSDDVAGRTRMYEKIVKGDNTLEAGLPESFNVLVKELQALALDVRLLEEEEGN
ncbi:DNA-directed RNA polymerase subunit beta [Syntrophobacter fumaroxidans]|uniref:DNA-directed RNA polymerase subunit beta n=1 Tax=Syntrophobacter fumaroxidans (strain DSM 10017 / MPOB) TaxID=335543 RepID=RPOB_SYNFM|nr:DNA-directed RNA polymerase subunit beta [Syntrophobacter fumaroxidans]A0LII4.1 RecName: Full=DNA-directed RNA polymerase subunit beta; Short=RNAP subunit beta; AltName: Full=RNA polymerase subunit beta; AltName: Full=Transcriptase subunit beta [Syntrophobacter fumaroxidans MPOB]ABK17236.1 DNA-directed RNA polymerase, beta subunit [Syntrophobacter fumaroxidans MPOB]